ncbi:DASH complex subunit Dad1-domain-containing protein [Mycena belliarum]|uniref:DASH complex subunit DAD1 n=1 Tax=Mycena belliarum TaxID=1033014 RepID=A0AAD6XHX4_9AGAR|nr:DASH complex subunit Dad1-domain-containing protein [Mycena belliae]
MAQPDEDPSFFERERERFTREISTEFDELLSSTNGLNRKLEEVVTMTKEYATIAELWSSFYQLMRSAGQEETGEEPQTASAPGASASHQ